MLQEAIYIYTKSQLNPSKLHWMSNMTDFYGPCKENSNFTFKMKTHKKYSQIKILGLVYMRINFQFPVY